MKQKHLGLVQIGKKVRYYRRIAKLSQDDLANKSGLTQNYISSVELGYQNLSAISIMRLAKALNIQVGVLFPDVRELSI